MLVLQYFQKNKYDELTCVSALKRAGAALSELGQTHSNLSTDYMVGGLHVYRVMTHHLASSLVH